MPVSASSDFHQSWVYHTGGVMEWGWTVPYAILKGRNTLARAGREDLIARMDEYVIEPGNFGQPLSDQWYRHLPLRDWIDRLKEAAPYFHEYFDEELDGPYWWPINMMRQAGNVTIPMYHITAWYDIFMEGAINAFQSIQQHGGSELARRNQKLLIGPWAHLRPFTPAHHRGAGDIDFGAEAAVELHEDMLRWYDYWLKDIETGIMDDAPVRIFVMGDNRWRDEQEWPLARTHYTRWYLPLRGGANTGAGDGTLSTVPPDPNEPQDQFIYDPADPAPTLGGNTLIIDYGVFDQSPAENRPDVLVYTSDPLPSDLELTGPISVTLYAATTAADTDFTAKLVDVRPDGYATTCRTESSAPATARRCASRRRSSRDVCTSTPSTCGPPATSSRRATASALISPAATSPGSTAIPIPGRRWARTLAWKPPGKPSTTPRNTPLTSRFR